MSARLITKSPIQDLARSLAETIKKTEFLDRNVEEKRHTVMALAKCGEASSVDFLRQVVDSPGSETKHDELRMAALVALSEIDDSKAETTLQEWASKKTGPRPLREAAKRLLQRPNPQAQGPADG